MSLFSVSFARMFSKKTQPYQVINSDPAVSSSEDCSASDRASYDGLLEKEWPLQRRRLSIWRRYYKLIIAHIVLFILYCATIYTVATHRPKDIRSVGLPFSPAIEALQWEEHEFSLGDRIQEQSPFSGKPSPALDQAWHDLLNDGNIKLEPEVMKHYGREDIAVAIPEGGGYIGTLNVFHELHCLKRLHQHMYSDYYWPHLDKHSREMNRLHNEHCIDFLRQSSMCHGDIGLVTFEWNATSRIPVANATSHQCVNWVKLDRWTKERSVDMMKPGWLVHPTLGLAYPDGKGDEIGALESKKPGP